ncbi:hypothetical protein Ae717Ps2_7242 [Pseudonocardia sp. Ae717_Ps2]|nr:hypothetical protein Ae717Ps2_7242 [Pseudonocardia sp. Ae717_Ps2]
MATPHTVAGVEAVEDGPGHGLCRGVEGTHTTQRLAPHIHALLIFPTDVSADSCSDLRGLHPLGRGAGEEGHERHRRARHRRAGR